MKLGATLVGMSAVGLLCTAVPATASPALSAADASAQQSATAAIGWQDGGRISVRRDELLMDASNSGVVVAVATTNSNPQHPQQISTVSRRTPNGHWTRLTGDFGYPRAVDVGADGDAVILSTEGVDGGDVIVTQWERGAGQIRSRVLVPAADQPPASWPSMFANGRGDIAVLLVPDEGSGDEAMLLRKPADGPWRQPLTIDPTSPYDVELDSVDITPTGAVVGAFTRGQTLSVRTLPLVSDTFGDPTVVTTWAGGLEPGSHANVTVGVNGDLATIWSYPESWYVERIRLNIVPVDRRPWQDTFRSEIDDLYDVVAVGRDGSVVVQDSIYTRRWDPQSRSFTGGNTSSWFKDDNEQGDVLIGRGIYGGALQLWPVGQPLGPKVDSPRGKQVAVVLTGDHKVYVASLRDDASPAEYRLSIRQF